MQLIQWIVSFISTILFFVIQGSLVLLIFNKKQEIKLILFFAIVNAAARDFLLSVLGRYIASMSLLVYILVIVLTIKLIFKLKLLQTICAASFLIILSAIFNSIVVAILKISIGTALNYSVLEKSFTYMLIGKNLSNLLLFVTVLLIYYFKMKIVISEDLNRKKVFGIIVNALVSCIIVIPNMLFFENNVDIIPLELVIFNAISILLLFILGVYNSIRSGELETKKLEVEFQKLYINTLNDSIDGMRGFKHDYNNTVQAIGGYLSLNNIDGLKKYYQQMQADSRVVNNFFPLNSYVKDNPAIYGLLLSKLSYAELNNIQFVINITTKIDIGNVKVFDFCKIFGILLDNALEAAVDSSKNYIELFISKRNSLNGIIIEILNSYQGEINTEVIFDNGFTTKEGHSGFGLWEVKKILSKYKNCCIKTYASNDIFTQQIVILHS